MGSTFSQSARVYVCACVRACVCVHARARARVCVCVKERDRETEKRTEYIPGSGSGQNIQSYIRPTRNLKEENLQHNFIVSVENFNSCFEIPL